MSPIAFIRAIVIVAFGFGTLESTAAPGPLEARLSEPFIAVVRLNAQEKWEPMLDQAVQALPAAASLGARWTRDNPAWRKARGVLGARLDRVVDSYAKSGQAERDLQAAIARDLPGGEAQAMARLLEGPGGAMLLRTFASTAYISAAMSGPNEPQPGQPAWNDRIQSLTKKFDERIGTGMPRKVEVGQAEMEKLWAQPVAQKGMPVFMNAARAADVKITGAMNLLLFDENAAIQRELAAAVAGAK